MNGQAVADHALPSVELGAVRAALDALPRFRSGGRVTSCRGGNVTASGLAGHAGVGSLCLIERRDPASRPVLFEREGALLAEIVGFDGRGVQLLPYEEAAGIAPGARVALEPGGSVLRPSPAWRGRVLDAMGRPMDGGPALPAGSLAYPIQARGLPAERRRGLGPGSRSACGRWTCSHPAATGSAWESSPARAWASPPSWR